MNESNSEDMAEAEPNLTDDLDVGAAIEINHVTVDTSGRFKIPAAHRDRYKITPDDVVDVMVFDHDDPSDQGAFIDGAKVTAQCRITIPDRIRETHGYTPGTYIDAVILLSEDHPVVKVVEEIRREIGEGSDGSE